MFVTVVRTAGRPGAAPGSAAAYADIRQKPFEEQLTMNQTKIRRTAVAVAVAALLPVSLAA
ncbi:hypothetical protein ACH4OX_28415, partial [Streptomyces roseolus]